MFLYLLLVHTPLHYARCLQSGRVPAMLTAAAFSACAFFFGLRGKRSVSLGAWRQRVVAAHVLNEIARWPAGSP